MTVAREFSLGRADAVGRVAAVARETSTLWFMQLVPGGNTPGESPLVRDITLLKRSGARPRYHPSGSHIIYDAENEDGYYDVWIMDALGGNARDVTTGVAGLPQKHIGNAQFSPDGTILVFGAEATTHYGESGLADPGLGLYHDLYAIRTDGVAFSSGAFAVKLTNIPIKLALGDGIQTRGCVNAYFSADGTKLRWTDFYADGGRNNFGYWRIRDADVVYTGNTPGLANERVVYTPPAEYATAMGDINPTTLLIAGNLDSQHPHEMQQYSVDISNIAGPVVTWLGGYRGYWSEGSSISPYGGIAAMSGRWTHYVEDPNRSFAEQIVERDLWYRSLTGTVQRLTYFNEPTAPEFVGPYYRANATNNSFSPDGESLVCTLGIDEGGPYAKNVRLCVAKVTFTTAL